MEKTGGGGKNGTKVGSIRRVVPKGGKIIKTMNRKEVVISER